MKGSALLSAVGLVLAAGSCSKPAEPPQTPAEPTAAAPTEEPSDAVAAPEEGAPAEGDEPAAEADPDKPPRTVKYIMTTGGLEIEVEGVRFVPRAKAIKSGKGWGVRIEVDAKVIDQNAHSLLAPDNGPLAFAGSVERGGPAERIVDKRSGEAEQLIAQGDKVTLSREWPGKGGAAPISAGQTLTLEVGLWGLGPDADQRRPVRDFFQVKLRGGSGKPQPVITPPPSANP